VTYTGNNRTHMIRIPDAGRLEFRLADGAANPYLLQAGLAAAGLDGIVNERDPGKRLDINMYTDGHKVKGAKKLPLNMLDAMRALEKSKVLGDRLGDAFVSGYLKLKQQEWNDFSRHLTQWERDRTLDI
jgi:glutamine synthetase